MEAHALNNLLCYYAEKSEIRSDQKSEEDVMIKFCQKQSFADILQNRCS